LIQFSFGFETIANSAAADLFEKYFGAEDEFKIVEVKKDE